MLRLFGREVPGKSWIFYNRIKGDHNMSTEPRIALAEETTAQTVKPHQTMDVVQNGLSALINIVGDIQERLAKLEGTDTLWVETMQETILSAADQAVETACQGVDWEDLAAQAVRDTDCEYMVESNVESCVENIDWSEHAQEAIADAVDTELNRCIEERLSKIKIGIIDTGD